MIWSDGAADRARFGQWMHNINICTHLEIQTSVLKKDGAAADGNVSMCER